MARVHLVTAPLGFALMASGFALFAAQLPRGLYLAPIGSVFLIVATNTRGPGSPALTSTLWEERARTAGWPATVAHRLWRTLTVLGWLTVACMLLAIVRH